MIWLQKKKHEHELTLSIWLIHSHTFDVTLHYNSYGEGRN